MLLLGVDKVINGLPASFGDLYIERNILFDLAGAADLHVHFDQIAHGQVDTDVGLEVFVLALL